MPRNTTGLALNNRRADGTAGESRLFNVRLTAEEFALLDAQCARTGRCRSDEVRAWLRSVTAPCEPAE
jgi:hypothetical protein